MKQLTVINIFAIAMLFISGCKKDIVGRTDETEALNPVNIDLNAGIWKTLLLTAPDEFTVAPPIATSSADYRIQLNEIKSWQAGMNASDKALVKYWGAGAVLRWNEIMRALVAKHNVAPYQNADGTYPIPDANNPLAYPLFPFANPPYAARAYAYMSTAQYDALVAAHHYKKLYNRAAPYKVDGGIQLLLPASDLPSYPSEDAVAAGAATEMMKLLFPGDQAYIQQQLEQHRRARFISGANVRSDWEAGETLGRAVAQKFIARARGDRAGAAVGNAALWAQLESNTIAAGEIPWRSLESPKRPPMLPLFGRVRTWLFDSATLVTTIRPTPPPSTNSQQFQQELNEVLNESKNQSPDRIRIIHYWADGVSTYTPPGHWNAIASDDFIAKRFSEVRWARNMALLNMSLMDAAIACWDAKYFYFNPRPSQVNPAIKTLTGLPNFPSYISGHSTFSGAAATILGHIVPTRKAAYAGMAEEASLSRLYGGLHYRSDCNKGLECGNKVGDYAIQRARTDGAE